MRKILTNFHTKMGLVCLRAVFKALTICQSLSDWSVRKWNARVLRTERTGSGQTGPAHEVGPLSSLMK